MLNRYFNALLLCLIGCGSMVGMNNKLIKGAAIVPPLYTFKLLLDKAGQPAMNKSKTNPPCIKPVGAQHRFEVMMRSLQDY